MPMPRWIILALVSLTTGASTGCDPGVPDIRTGFTRTPTGDVVLRQVLCEGQRVKAVEVYELKGRRGVIADDDDVLLWKITSSAPTGAALSEFVIGQEAEGFHEAHPLSEPLPQSARIAALVTTTDGMAAGDAEISELKPGVITQDSDRMGSDSDRFTERGRESCS